MCEYVRVTEVCGEEWWIGLNVFTKSLYSNVNKQKT